ncbi:tetraacyldisaccharide 4'-kinase [Kangiella sp. HD9-110m-PIT-SAG06]|nr:tetraacyldisaccharide 4'-kinase [Kangiella sp. HD9-110m-PIT-SAG06]RDX35563.1 tetraacyldisaccharide 4'-kinase [Kangiella sp. HD9-110m-PIT-SAG07]
MAISKSQAFFERLWYRPTPWWLWLFLPLQLLLRLVVLIRHSAYRFNFFKSTKLSRPVVVIGNITVGGTGKTPLAIHILQWLQKQGYKPGLVTRGYAGTAENHPLVIDADTSAEISGDEPYLIFHKTQAMVVVDPIRSRGGQKLIDLGCDIVICDDGLQHYALKRDLEIAVIDGSRGLGNGWLMPMGPLREPKARLSAVDLQVINGQTMTLEPQAIQGLGHDKPLTVNTVNAVAAIGNPQRFFDTLSKEGFKVTAHSYPDHHRYQAGDFDNLKGPIVMTEKDAVKCHQFTNERMYYLPVKTQLADDIEQKLQRQLLALL